MKESYQTTTTLGHLRETDMPTSANGGDERLPISPRHNLQWAWLLWERRRFLTRLTICGALIALIISLLIPNRYASTIKLMPPEHESGTALLAAMAGKGGLGSVLSGGLAGDLLGVNSSGALFTEIIHSRSVQDRMVDRFDLRKVYSRKYYQDADAILAKFTEVGDDKKSGVITITVTDRDKARAQHMAQAYVDELDRMVALVSTSAARRERIFLEQRLQQVKLDLNDAANRLAQYSSSNTMIDVTSQTTAMVQGAAVLQGQLIAAQSELEGLQQIYTPTNVRVRALRARVDELRGQLQKMGGTDKNLNSPPTNGAKSESDQFYPSIRKLPLLGVKWQELYRNAKIQETVFGLLTEQYELAKIQEAKEIPTVKMLDPPNWPERKSTPHRTSMVVLGGLVTFGLGIVWVLGMATWQHLDPEDPRKQLGDEIISRLSADWRLRTESFPPLLRIWTWWKDDTVSRSSSADDPVPHTRD